MTHSADYSIKPEVTTNTQRMHLKLLIYAISNNYQS